MTNDLRQTAGDMQALEMRQQLERARKVGSFFKARREQAQMTVAAVAEDLGLESPSLLANYESGATPMPLDEIFALSNVLNVPPDEVLALIYDLSLAAVPSLR